MAKAKAVNAKASVSTAAEKMQATAAKTWRDAVGNVLTDVAKSAHKIVTDSTAEILKTLQESSHNWYHIGQELTTVAKAINAVQFSRLISEVYSRFGLSKPTIYRWMGNVEVLDAAITYAPARDAILTVFNGQGLVSRTDGKATLTGTIAAGLKKHPAPNTGTYVECMDWAREVQLVAEKSATNSKQSMEEFYKAINSRFEKLLKKRYDLAVEHVIYCYRMLEQTSQILAATTLEAIEDSSISTNAAGKMALEGIKKAATDRNVANQNVAA